jgi:hypothetical protein
MHLILLVHELQSNCSREVDCEKKTDKRVMAPSWVSRGLHSESGGGRGLTARDAVCVGLRLAI